jgi:hypothetical protein
MRPLALGSLARLRAKHRSGRRLVLNDLAQQARARVPPDHKLASIRADDRGSQPIVLDNFEAMLLEFVDFGRPVSVHSSRPLP